MDTGFSYVVGSPPLDQQLEFVALSVVVDNPTNQWIRLDSLGVVIPQYTLGATYPLPGTTRAQASFTAPAGQTEPPIVAAQFATISFNSLALPSTAGVGMLGGRAPYYDRNPLSIVQGNAGGTIRPANSGTNNEWTYTVPAGRKAYIETAYVMVQITTAYANDGAVLQTAVGVAPLGGVNKAIAVSLIFVGTLAGTIAVGLIGGAMELQATDVLTGSSSDSRAAGAGAAVHYATAKLTEFDA